MTKMNKKGTSLVELIAVIVIMGIIAAIAVPTTIGVINRQKKNAAEKSVEAIVNALKNRAIEEMTSSTVYVGVNFAQKDNMYVQCDGTAITATPATGATEALGIDNAKIEAGSMLIIFNVSAGTYTLSVDGFKVDGYNVTVSNTQAPKCEFTIAKAA